MPRIYTKTGDDGTTGLLYGGRTSKASAVAEAAGTIDEAVAAIGLARALSGDATLRDTLLDLQRQLFVVGADLSTNPAQRDRLEPGVSRVSEEMVGALEERIDRLVLERPLPEGFVVPGTDPVSACLDVSRAVIRRAERAAVRLGEETGSLSSEVRHYLNRLSDLLFVLARSAAGAEEPPSRER